MLLMVCEHALLYHTLWVMHTTNAQQGLPAYSNPCCVVHACSAQRACGGAALSELFLTHVGLLYVNMSEALQRIKAKDRGHVFEQTCGSARSCRQRRAKRRASLPGRLRGVLHRPIDLLPDSWDATWEAGGRALYAAHARQPLPPVWPPGSPGRLCESAPLALHVPQLSRRGVSLPDMAGTRDSARR